jgi:hypothetical protein
MSKRVLLCLSHAIEEYQQLDLLSSLGYEVASIGGYVDPEHPHDPKRPPLHVPFYEEVKAAVDALGTDDNLGAAQANLPDAVLDWLGDDGVIVYHHRLERLFGQWPRIADWRKGGQGRRVVWRSVGQSVQHNEREAAPFRMAGLERVLYSPRERNIPDFSGDDALIRFWGYEEDRPWVGDREVVIQVSQHLRQRDPFTNWEFWDSATRDLPRLPIGPGSEVIGGTGSLPYDEMREHLLRSRAFLFTGSQPASYTLGLVEAMHAGIPTVSIGPSWMKVKYEGGTAEELFEGHELAPLWGDDPNDVRHKLRGLLMDADRAEAMSRMTRARARSLFDRTTVAAQWAAFLG